MNNKMIFAAGFVIGGLTGVFGCMQYFKKKYEAIAQEEIDSVKEAWEDREPLGTEDKQPDEARIAAANAAWKDPNATYSTWNNPDVTIYSSVNRIIKDEEYSSDSKRETRHERPYVIKPEEFGDMEGEGYDSISLTYYLDGTLAEGREIIENIDETIGLVSLNHFGEYEDDSVFVRNDKFKCDYEILLDQRSFAEAMK